MMDKDMDKTVNFHPVVNVSKLKPAGEHRPAPRSDGDRSDNAHVFN
jgi:hypothetical protein